MLLHSSRKFAFSIPGLTWSNYRFVISLKWSYVPINLSNDIWLTQCLASRAGHKTNKRINVVLQHGLKATNLKKFPAVNK